MLGLKQEANFLPGLNHLAFDISTTIPPDSWYGTLLKGVFNFQPDPTLLQVIVWVLCLLPVMAFFLAPERTRPAPQPRRRRPRRRQPSSPHHHHAGGPGTGLLLKEVEGDRGGLREVADRGA